MVGVPNHVGVSILELQGQARVVRYLRERANGLSKVADGMHPEYPADVELKRTTEIKAMALRDAAWMVQEGISRGLVEYYGQDKPHTVCPSCGRLLAIIGHNDCGSPCYDDHIEKCPNDHR